MVVLASTSQQKKDLLRSAGIDFVSQPPICDEKFDSALPLVKIPTALATRKVTSIKDRLAGKAQDADFIVASDCFAALDGEYYGKPADRNEAGLFLRRFSGRTHGILTGISLYNRKTMRVFEKVVKSSVSIAPLTDDEIERYLDTNEWVGAAGGYRIQGRGALFVTHLVGSSSAVAGFPLETFFAMMRMQGGAFSLI